MRKINNVITAITEGEKRSLANIIPVRMVEDQTKKEWHYMECDETKIIDNTMFYIRDTPVSDEKESAILDDFLDAVDRFIRLPLVVGKLDRNQGLLDFMVTYNLEGYGLDLFYSVSENSQGNIEITFTLDENYRYGEGISTTIIIDHKGTFREILNLELMEVITKFLLEKVLSVRNNIEIIRTFANKIINNFYTDSELKQIMDTLY